MLLTNVPNEFIKPGIALVVGAGDATGGAIARRFARAGLVACVTRRSADKLQPLVDQIRADGGLAHGFASDARKEDDVVALIDNIERTIGTIEVLVFNIGANAPSSVLEETARRYFKIWEMACLAGFLNAREVAKRMMGRSGTGHKGTIIFTGAIDTAFICDGFPERYALKEQDGILNPDHIADAYWMLHQQPRDAWTHELDLRPWIEKF